jgi:hypothetical protein
MGIPESVKEIKAFVKYFVTGIVGIGYIRAAKLSVITTANEK